MTTADTQAANIVRTTPLALLALATHMLDHHLPAPVDLRLPAGGDRCLVVFFADSADGYDWIDAAVFAQDDHSVVASVNGEFEHVRYDGRLPDSGVRVRVQWTRPVTRTLVVVPR